MRFLVKTTFDITATGITGHFKPAKIPFKDRAGQVISSEVEWNRARNQQRNYETLIQLLSLRTQIFDLSPVRLEQGLWQFDFEIETPEVYGTKDDPISVLVTDSESVPMLINVDNYHETGLLVTSGNEQNIWFELINNS